MRAHKPSHEYHPKSWIHPLVQKVPLPLHVWRVFLFQVRAGSWWLVIPKGVFESGERFALLLLVVARILNSRNVAFIK